MTRVFVYGTLMSGAILARVAPHARVLDEATLPGYKRIERGGLPTVVADPDADVRGFLIAVADEDLAALDFYEGVEVGLYRRDRMKVEVGSEPVDAEVYVMGSGAW